MNKYSLRAYNNTNGRTRFYTTFSAYKFRMKIKELTELGYKVEVKDEA